jgi:hypothetical protein
LKYIKLENNIPTDYTLEQLFQDYPDAVIYKDSQMPDEQLLLNYNVYPLITTDRPNGDVDTEGVPILVGHEWHQTWISRSFTAEELLQKQQELQEQTSQWFSDSEVSAARYTICQSCDNFSSLTTLCKECNCFMLVKTKLQAAVCPINKW